MSEFIELDAKAPATLGAVVEAITRLSTLGEAKLMELVSAGKIQEVFPFRPNPVTDIGADFVAEEDLIEASPAPLSRAERTAHIQESMPVRREPRTRAGSSRGRQNPYGGRRIPRRCTGRAARRSARPHCRSRRSDSPVAQPSTRDPSPGMPLRPRSRAKGLTHESSSFGGKSNG
jgi:hypothetical protein